VESKRVLSCARTHMSKPRLQCPGGDGSNSELQCPEDDGSTSRLLCRSHGQFELPLPNETPRTIVRLSLARARYTYKIQDLFTRARDTAAAMLVRHGNRQ
jgi:hypothetical protein